MKDSPDIQSGLLISQPLGDEFDGLGIPKPTDNVFTRIIRDPVQPDRPMRERRCTEMLCGVLASCEALRSIVLKWLAAKAAYTEDLMDDLDWRLGTERAIGSKRDDLRIEGWRDGNEDERLEVLWTVEVKVQAGFHMSTDQTGEQAELDDDASATDEPSMVNQLSNYDRWLASQDNDLHKAGFVLAIPDLQNDLPEGLTCAWHCITWTALGKVVVDALAADVLPPAETGLARHLFGFIRQHLWRSEEMSENHLSFDHAALMRAVWTIGKECETIVNNLVVPLAEVVEQCGLGISRIALTGQIFMGNQRRLVQGLLVSAQGSEVYFDAGFDSGGVLVWIESAPGHPKKSEMQKRAQELLPELRLRNPNWTTDRGGSWPDIGVRMPLLEVLVAENQGQAIRQFVQCALADLKAVGFDGLIRSICDGIE